MATHKTKRKQGKLSHKKPFSRGIVAGFVFVSTIVTALLSFISVPLGVMGFGVFALTALIYSDQARRRFWEQSASFKFKNIEEKQEEQLFKSNLNRRDIAALKSRMDDLELDMQESPQRNSEAPTAKAPPRQFTPEKPIPKQRFEAFEAETMPKAIKPGRPDPAFETPDAAQNDDPYDESAEMSDLVIKELLHHAVSNKRVDVFLQPIMRMPQRQIRFYELFARIRAKPGLYLSASRYMEIAEQDNLNSSIDNLLLLHSLKVIEQSAHIEKATPFFINITSATLRNGLFMKRLLGFLSQNKHLAPRLVFEIGQSDFEELPPALLEIIKGLGTLGCSFSLDHVEHMEFDILDLQRFQVRFVKLHTAMLLEAAKSSKGFADMHRAKRKLEANGIGVIVERIESEDQMRELTDFDIHYGQGYLLGKPDLQGAYKKRTRAKRMGYQEDVA